MITQPKKLIRPVTYPDFLNYWEMSCSSPWWHKSINMSEDVVDWNSRLSPEEKNVIGNILKGFAQTETEVSTYWSKLIPTWFPVNEIEAMGMEFAARECLHARAYDLLSSTIGLDDFEGFMKEPSIAARMEELLKITDDDDYKSATLEDIAVSIAVFSAACEGIQLFSAFSILLSFRNRYAWSKRLSGVSEQMEWSIQDENLHSIAGCHLFRVLCDENPGLREKAEDKVKDGLLLAVALEKNYLDKIFELGDIPTIKKEEVLAFLYNRANLKYKELGYDELLYTDINPELLEAMDWFDQIMSSNKDNDFFSSHSSNYSKPLGNWDF